MTVEERIKNRKIGIIGMARSGMAAAFLADQMGGKPFVSDAKAAEHLSGELERLLKNRKFILFCVVLFVVLVLLSIMPLKNFWLWVHRILPGDPFHPKSLVS